MTGSVRSTLTTPGRLRDFGHVARLLVIYGEGGANEGLTRAVASTGLEIRRAGESDEGLALDDPSVSRLHARVQRDGPADAPTYRLQDLDSKNGTFLNGRQVASAPLQSGDVIRVGSHLLLFEILDLAAVQGLPLKRQQGEALVGESHALSRVRESIRKSATLDVPVLILGESGVGKELVAAEVHRHSERSGAFVPVNCAAIAENLVESELFGHQKGAFTGAMAASKGLFGEAEKGTIFLDEIGEMPLAMQAKLLRVLATGEVRAVGATEVGTVDVRVVAATNVDLREAVDDGRFRGDLYSRLIGATIRVPPLRDRKDDVLRLVRHFLDDPEVQVGPDAAEALVIHAWEFNVRELGQVVATIRPDAQRRRELTIDALPEPIRGEVGRRSSTDVHGTVEAPLWMRVNREKKPTESELREVVGHYKGNVHHIAEFFGKDRKQVYRWIEKYAIDIESFRGEDSADS